MANDGQVIFEVEIDSKNAKADLKDVTRAIASESKKWEQSAQTSTNNIGNSFGNMLKKISAGVVAAKVGQALLDIGKAAIQAASDLEEVQNVVDVTFGSDAGKIEAWAKNASTQFGLTETQAKRFSSTMGAMLKSAGLAGSQITQVSTDLAGLAADMASFYNLDFDTAFQKIRSGISGETEPLKQLGINMSVANLNAYALQKGLSKTFEQMNQGEQTMLRYQYIMSATSDAQGDFARTSDGYANAMRTLETRVETLKTALGKPFLGVVADAVTELNKFLDLIAPDEKKRTVMDDFADIDLKTDEKIAAIQQTALEAKALVGTLEEIGGEKSNNAGSKVQQLVNDLTNINLNQGKAGIVKDFIATLGQNIDVIAGIKETDADGAKAWLESISNAANTLNDDDAKGWTDLLNSIKEGLPGLENTDFGSSLFSALGAGFGEITSETSVLQWAIEALGNKTNKTADEQALWLETCNRLVKTIPGLSAVINTETGEVKGGTQAIKDYVKAWEEGQIKLAAINNVKEKRSALEQKFSELPELKLDTIVAAYKRKNALEELAQMYDKLNLGAIELDGHTGKIIRNTSGMTTAQKAAYNALVDAYEAALQEEEKAKKAYQEQEVAYQLAEKALDDYEKTVESMPGTIEDVVDANEEWIKSTGKTSDEIKTLVNDAQTALTNLKDYVQGVHDSAQNAVESVVKGFNAIETPMMKNRKNVKDLEDSILKLDSSSKTYKEDLAKINDELAKQRGEQISAQSVGKNLQQQAQYMEDYLANLRRARELGLSADVLAALSDGSTESYDVLEQLAQASPEEVATINAAYQDVIDKKKELTDELTQQQLTVDETYQTLATKAQEAVAALDLEQSAKDNAGKTVQGVVDGITSKLPDVTDAVNAIMSEIDRLAGFGITVDVDAVGLSISKGNQSNRRMINNRNGEYDFIEAFGGGVDYVPFDMYARIHEGEKILNAQEAAVYRNLLNGGTAGVDLDALGGVMRDNVKPGGNVYLDGKVVGAVVSDRQGRSYKSLQRSGWQS